MRPIAFATWFNMVAPLALVMFFVVSYVLSIGAEDVKIIKDESVKAMNGDQKRLCTHF